jgi:predicted acetyltransferase
MHREATRRSLGTNLDRAVSPPDDMGEGMNMDIELRSVVCEDGSVLRNLLQPYLHDFSEIDGAEVNEHGLYEYEHEYADLYWSEPGRHGFIVRADGKLAGFVLVREGLGDEPHYIAEFFVMRKYRRQGVGRIVAHRVFGMFPGRWRIEQAPANTAAQAFWRRVIGEYTGGRFEEVPGVGECPPPGQEFDSAGGAP